MLNSTADDSLHYDNVLNVVNSRLKGILMNFKILFTYFIFRNC